MPTDPSVSPVLKSLTYVSEEPPISPPPLGGSPFGGYPSLKQRNDSFDIKENMSVHCGYGLYLLNAVYVNVFKVMMVFYWKIIYVHSFPVYNFLHTTMDVEVAFGIYITNIVSLLEHILV